MKIFSYLIHRKYIKIKLLKTKLIGKQAALGLYCRVVFISKSGSEGLSFHGIRQVHIMETAWQRTLEDQVKGRAIRIGSHTIFENNFDEIDEENEPEELKTSYKFKKVYVYKHLLRLYTSNYYGQLYSYLFNKNGENGLTTDVYINNFEKTYTAIIDFYNQLKKHSINCIFGDENLECNNTINIQYNKLLKYALDLKNQIEEKTKYIE